MTLKKRAVRVKKHYRRTRRVQVRSYKRMYGRGQAPPPLGFGDLMNIIPLFI
jgi:hypothetical protein